MPSVGDIPLHFSQDDVTRWGSGDGENAGGHLSATQANLNIWYLAQAILAIRATPPAANNIASITVSGMTMTVTLQDGTAIGPLALPVLQYRFRGTWAPTTLYAVLDSFLVPGQGLYTVNIAHTSASSFDAAAVDGSGNPLYAQVWPGDFGAPYVYNAPTTGTTVTAAALDVRLLLDPAGALATLTVKLPPTPTDGQVYLIATSQAIAALTVSPPGSETVKGGSLALSAGTGALWLYRAANTTWYRIGGPYALAALSDVVIGSPATGDKLSYDGTDWVNRPDIPGTATNDDASSGDIGEYASDVIASGSAVSLTTATPANIASLSLTAGDWDVSGTIGFSPAGSTVTTQQNAAINTTSATLPTFPGDGVALSRHSGTTETGVGDILAVGPCRLSLASTTTVYLVAQAAFTTSTNAGYGILRARRVR